MAVTQLAFYVVNHECPNERIRAGLSSLIAVSSFLSCVLNFEQLKLQVKHIV